MCGCRYHTVLQAMVALSVTTVLILTSGGFVQVYNLGVAQKGNRHAEATLHAATVGAGPQLRCIRQLDPAGQAGNNVVQLAIPKAIGTIRWQLRRVSQLRAAAPVEKTALSLKQRQNQKRLARYGRCTIPQRSMISQRCTIPQCCTVAPQPRSPLQQPISLHLWNHYPHNSKSLTISLTAPAACLLPRPPPVAGCL